MARSQALIQRHPVTTYFVLAIAISWAAIFLVIGPGGFLGTETIPDSVMTMVYMATLLGPSLSSVLLTAALEGLSGVRRLFSRLGVWRAGIGWYALAFLVAPLAIGGALVILVPTSSAFVPTLFAAGDKAGTLAAGIVGGLMVGIFEELGWTGFAVSRLRQRQGVLATGLIVGLVWGLWHGPLFLGAVRTSAGLPDALDLFIRLFTFLPAFRVLMVWMYDRTGSLPLAMIMHMFLTASTLILQPAATGIQVAIYDLVFAALLWAAVAVAAISGGGRLTAERGMTAQVS